MRRGSRLKLLRAARRYARQLSKRSVARPSRGLLLATLAAIVLLLIPVAIATRPPLEETTFAIADLPPHGELRNFYGLEQNSFGPFRWAKPDATIVVPVAAPGVYRVSVTLQDSSLAPQGRTVTISAGDATRTLALTSIPQDYSFAARLDPLIWADQSVPALTIRLQSAPFLPPGDPRPLGPIVARIAITPIGAVAPPWVGVALLLGAIIFLIIILRVLGTRAHAIVLFVLVLGLGLTGLGLLARSLLLRLIALPALYAPSFLIGLIGLAAGLGLARVAAQAAPGHTCGRSTGGNSAAGQRWYHAILLGPLILAAILRFGNLDALSLWLDEGATVHFAGLSWHRVVGLEGAYDLHPPLYYALVKAAEPFVGVVSAGRFVSALAGTLTVAAVYALVAHVLGWRAAFVGSLLLALSPLHIWYSQEARMYALATLFVTIAALALVRLAAYDGQPRARRWWAAIFSGATLAAAYSVYSAFYTLVPLAVPIIWLVWRQRRQALPLLVALAVAVVGYVPWLPQIITATRSIAGDKRVLASRSDYLAATPDTVRESLLSVIGAGGMLQSDSNSRPLFWEQWASWRGLFLFACLLVILIGAVVLARRATVLAGIAGAFLVGTIVVAILTSLASPGYADRTILAAVVGWSIVGGASVSIARPRWLMVVNLLSCVILLVVAVNTVTTLRASGAKQQYRELLADASQVAVIGKPVVPLGSWMVSLAGAYAPTLRASEIVYDKGRLVVPQVDGAPADALWLAYADNSWDNIGAVQQQLTAQGYRRYLHKYYPNPLYLDLYALPNAYLGQPIAIDTHFTQWSIKGSSIVRDSGPEGSILHLSAQSAPDASATLNVPVMSSSVVTLSFSARLAAGQGPFNVSLTCLSASGSPVELASNEAAAGFPNDSSWHTARVSTLCPRNTAIVQIYVDNQRTGAIDLRDPALLVSLLQPGTP